MGVVPEATPGPTAPLDRVWDWHGHERTLKIDALLTWDGWNGMAAAHTWYQPKPGTTEPPAVRSAYKLAHHELVDGELMVVWHGVRAAMEALDGAREALKVPDEDHRAIWEHLAFHYRQFAQNPPPFRG